MNLSGTVVRWDYAGRGTGLTRNVLRHKSRKASFRAGWWVTVLVHNAALTAWIFRDWLGSHGVLPA